jgi:hypothetical protein
MKKCNLIDIVTMLCVASFFLLVLMYTSGCSMKFYKKSPTDVRKCCERVNAHVQEMEKFNRYCKVALFLAKGDNKKEVGSGVKKAAREAVDVCKFVYRVESDDDLLASGDVQDYYRVRSYLIEDPRNEATGWMRMGCDPAEIHCEEF